MKNFIPTDEQEELVHHLIKWYLSFNKPWFSISGAAGTGKTTVIRYFLEKMNIVLGDVVAVAFVGKAVSMLSLNGLPAKTVHSLIYDFYWRMSKDEFGETITNARGAPKMEMAFKLKNKLDHSYKVIIIDEGSMINDSILYDLLSFGIPLIFLGDMNQLPPIFGESTVMLRPDFILTKIMRQAEGSPIIRLSQNVLNNYPLYPGQYGNSNIITSVELDSSILRKYDTIIVAKNKTRDLFNNYIRKNILKLESLTPEIGEKIICRQNNWDRHLGDGFYLTNGTSGIIEDIDKSTLTKGKVEIMFKSDFAKYASKVTLDNKYIKLDHEARKNYGMSSYDKFEYGYAITAHLSQGSQYPRVLFIDERFHDAETTKKLRYTAITRARERIDIVVNGRRLY